MAVRTSPAGGRAVPDWARIREGSDPGTVHLTVVDPGVVTAEAVQQCCRVLADAGYTRAITNAMGPADAQVLRSAGFEVSETLDLFARAVDTMPASAGRTRRARRLAPIVRLDQRAFADRSFDGASLEDARAATPVSRLRICGSPSRPIGYALTGVAGSRGYVQRLAVDPAARRRGIARRLLVDGLRWAHRRGARTVMVNTRTGNEAARALYDRAGFAQLPAGLCVLERAL